MGEVISQKTLLSLNVIFSQSCEFHKLDSIHPDCSGTEAEISEANIWKCERIKTELCLWLDTSGGTWENVLFLRAFGGKRSSEWGCYNWGDLIRCSQMNGFNLYSCTEVSLFSGGRRRRRRRRRRRELLPHFASSPEFRRADSAVFLQLSIRNVSCLWPLWQKNQKTWGCTVFTLAIPPLLGVTCRVTAWFQSDHLVCGVCVCVCVLLARAVWGSRYLAVCAVDQLNHVNDCRFITSVKQFCRADSGPSAWQILFQRF